MRIWDAQTGKMTLKSKGNMGNLNIAKYSPNGQTIAVASRDGVIMILDSTTGNLIQTLNGHLNAVQDIVYSPDGKNIISASSDGTIITWDSESGDLIHTLKGHKDVVFSANYSPNGRFIVSGGDKKSIMIWDSMAGKLIRTFIYPFEEDLGQLEMTIKYSPNGEYFLCFYYSMKVIQIRKSNTGELIHTLIGHLWRIKDANYSKDGRHIASKDYYARMIVWDTETGKAIYDFGKLSEYSPDKKYNVFSYENDIGIFDSETEKIVCKISLNERQSPAYYSSDGKNIVSSSSRFDEKLNILDSNTGALIQSIHQYTEEETWSKYSCRNDKFFAPKKSDIEIYLKEKAEIADSVIKEFEISDGVALRVNFSPDGKYILSVQNHAIKLWSSTSGEFICTLQTGNFCSSGVKFSPDGKFLIVASHGSDKPIKIWNCETKELVHTIYPLPRLRIKGAILKNVKTDDLTEHDFIALKQNGALIG